MNNKELKDVFEDACNLYLERFCKKQDVENEGWIADNIGGIAVCSDYFFSMDEIKKDIDSNQPKGTILNWYDDNLNNYPKQINYNSYCMGLRVADMQKK